MNFLFFVSGADIQTPTTEGLVGDKFEHWRQGLINRGHSVTVAYFPRARTRGSRRTAFPVISTRWILVWSLLETCTSRLFRSWSVKKIPKVGILALLRELYAEAHRAAITRLATKHSANAIFGIGLSSLEIDAAKQLNIPSVEVQHGQYGSSSDFGLYWPIMKPAYYCVWDYRTAQLAAGFGLNPVIVGFPITSNDLPIPNRRQRILLTLSWGFDHTVDPFGMIPQELGFVLTKLTDFNTPITIRLHPVHSAWSAIRRSRVQRWFAANFPSARISWPTSTSLEEDLRECYLHLTWESSVWFEAAIRGISTVIVNAKAYGGAAEFYRSNLESISQYCQFLDDEMPISSLAEMENWIQCSRPSIEPFDPERLLGLLR